MIDWFIDWLNGRLELRITVWLQAKVLERELCLRPRLYVGSVCDAQRRCSPNRQLVSLCKCLCICMSKRKVLREPHDMTHRLRWSPILWPSARHQPKLQDHGHGTSAWHGVPVYLPANADTNLYRLSERSRSRQRSGWEMNPGPEHRASSALITALSSFPLPQYC